MAIVSVKTGGATCNSNEKLKTKAIWRDIIFHQPEFPEIRRIDSLSEQPFGVPLTPLKGDLLGFVLPPVVWEYFLQHAL